MGESFYGGRRGPELNIVKSYDSKESLRDDFSKSSCEVPYGACVIINNREDLTDNGKLYRRSYSGEEYLGNISGPIGAGLNPTIFYNKENLIKIDDILNDIKENFQNVDIGTILAFGEESYSKRFFGYLEDKDNHSDWHYLCCNDYYIQVIRANDSKKEEIKNFLPEQGICLLLS